MDSKPCALLVTDSQTLNARFVTWALESLPQHAQDLHVITQADRLEGKLNLNSSSLDAVVSVCENHELHDQLWMRELARVLKPGGIIYLLNIDSSNQNVTQHKVALERNILLAGFVISGELDVQGRLVLKAQKPAWETGSSFSLKKKVADKSKIVAVSKPEAFQVDIQDNGFKLDIQDDIDDLIDEDSLLTEEDLKKPDLPQADDCEVGKAGRKACKGCTCGRAEIDEKQEKLQVTSEELNNFKSSCGNCYLGDAFRCSTCPYKGLPRFKPGEKITLTGSVLTADV